MAIFANIFTYTIDHVPQAPTLKRAQDLSESTMTVGAALSAVLPPQLIGTKEARFVVLIDHVLIYFVCGTDFFFQS